MSGSGGGHSGNNTGRDSMFYKLGSKLKRRNFMDNVEWKELHGIEQEKEVYLALTNIEFGELINDYVDYVVVLDITIYTDGTRDVHLVDELVNIFNDDGDIVESFTVNLPKKYRDAAIEKAKERDYL